MNCFHCKSEMTESTRTHVVDIEKCIVIIRNVPCFKCDRCGSSYYSDEVAQRLDEIVEAAEKLMTEIAVIEYTSDKVA